MRISRWQRRRGCSDLSRGWQIVSQPVFHYYNIIPEVMNLYGERSSFGSRFQTTFVWLCYSWRLIKRYVVEGTHRKDTYWFMSWHLRNKNSDRKGPGSQLYLQGSLSDDLIVSREDLHWKDSTPHDSAHLRVSIVVKRQQDYSSSL